MRYPILCCLTLALCGAAGCSDDDGASNPDGGSGGTTTGGGGAGGNSSGGGAATGGRTSTGGAGTTGGATATGGSTGTGGTTDGGADGSAPGEWDGCPTVGDYDGEASWTHPLSVTGGAVFCSTFDENRTLVEELAAKALLRVTPGEYRLPGADRANLGLPLCFRFGESAAAVAVTNGNATYTAATFDGTVTHQYEFSQGVTAFGAPHTMRTQLIDRAATGAPPAFVLDGTTADFPSQDNLYWFQLCPVGEQCFGHYTFDSCDHASSRLHTHVVTFSGGAGSVTFELRIGQSFSSTEPGAFVRASGTFKGTSFDQQDYWKLVYNPAHHHFVRNFAVLFDSPIEGACGIQVTGLEPFEDTGTPDAAAQVDCSLHAGAAIGIEAHQHTAPPP